MTRGAEALGKCGFCIDAMLFEYLHNYSRHDATTVPDYEQTGWNNAIEYMTSDIICNAHFSQWLMDQFHDKETAAAYISAFNEFIRKDYYNNGQKD